MSQGTSPLQHIDLSASELIEIALRKKEGVRSSNQAIAVKTGKRTGRSPKDRYLVQDATTQNIVDWNKINQPISPEIFAKLWQRAVAYIKTREHFISHLWVGADPHYALPVKIISELAWHNLFTHHLFIREKLGPRSKDKEWTMISAPNLLLNPERDGVNSDVAVILDMSNRHILVCGTLYAGEMKKAMFSVLNYILPEYDVLPMHCAANKGANGHVALFFGLSGTGKTTLSADPERYLIGDDEHGWSLNGIFNFEGGCYAKCINLSKENEPIIWNAIRDGAIMENVALDKETADPIYDDDSLTQNTRAAYPREYIPKRVVENYAGHPSVVIFLTCDLYGVLPPVALLTKEQAAYHFLSGYTALVGSTEMGSRSAVMPTFSTCFGAPFFPRPAKVYANLLIRRIEQTGCQVYLVNTGWTGGSYGKGGKRFLIPTTRAIIRAILIGELQNAETEVLPGFELRIPKQVTDVDTKILNPKNTWRDPASYDTEKQSLMIKFVENFKKFDVSQEIILGGPR
jgi:phosphoenolpyruvate carboxykinase (ATP)